MKFEYADLYRFSVSAGIVLITLSFLAPWLLLREPLDVLYSATDQEVLTEMSKGILEKKQKSLALAFTTIPYFSGGLILLGILLTSYGGLGWLRLQKIRDKKESIGLAREEHELETMTAGEKSAKMKTEIAEEFSGNETQTEMTSYMQKYDSLEGKIAERLNSIKGSTHNVMRHRRAGRSFIDILLEPKKKSDAISLEKHYIFEVKVRQRILYSDIKSSYLQLRNVASSYRDITQVVPKLKLVFIVPIYSETERIEKLLETFSLELGTNENHNIVFVSEQDLETLSDSDFAHRLGL